MMPAFAGSLRQYPLIEVLRTIETRQLTGRLHLRYDQLEALIYVGGGHWLLAERPGASLPLGALLVQAGCLTPPAFERAVGVPFSEAHAVSDQQTASMLMGARILSHDQLRTWAFQDASDLLEHVWDLPGGEFYFEENVTPPLHRCAIPLPLALLVPGTPARVAPNSGGGLIGSGGSIAASDPLHPMAEGARMALSLDPDAPLFFAPIDRHAQGTIRLTREQWRLLTMVDGQSTSRAIAANFQVPEAVVLRVVTELLNAGLVLVGEYA